MKESLVSIPAGRMALEGALGLPAKPHGVASLILGSVTQRVLAHSRIPVVVYR